jgi:hypothetical protein
MALSAGLPALFVLLGCTVAGGALTALLIGLGKMECAVEERVLRGLFLTKLIVAPTFWGWAVYNTAQNGFDLGVASFACAAVASAYGLMKIDSSDPKYLQCQRWSTGLSGAFVVAVRAPRLERITRLRP